MTSSGVDPNLIGERLEGRLGLGLRCEDVDIEVPCAPRLLRTRRPGRLPHRRHEPASGIVSESWIGEQLFDKLAHGQAAFGRSLVSPAAGTRFSPRLNTAVPRPAPGLGRGSAPRAKDRPAASSSPSRSSRPPAAASLSEGIRPGSRLPSQVDVDHRARHSRATGQAPPGSGRCGGGFLDQRASRRYRNYVSGFANT